MDIIIDELPPAASVQADYVFAGMRLGQTVKVTSQQLATFIVALVTDSAPSTLDTLNELAAALGDDPNFATTVMNALATKADAATAVTLTGTQTMTNKTLTAPRVRAAADATRIGQFDASSISSSTTRTYNLPDDSGEIELRSLNAPVISNANTLFTSGWYRTPGTWTGSPTAGTAGSNQGYLRVSSFLNGTDEILQEFTPIRATDNRLFRLREAGTFTPWYIRYSSRNLVGTVSQSSGLPTGAVIEAGTNANGRFTRWADGTMICTKLVNIGAVSFSASGNVFISSARDAGTSPSTFSTEPYVSVMVSSSSGTNWTTMAVAPTTTNLGQYYIFAPGNSSVTGVSFYVTATGRWY